jgi:hypothetical protein
VLGPDGLSRFDDLRRREAAHNAILYAFDLIAPLLDRKAALVRLSCDTNAFILLDEHVAQQKQKKEIG